MDVTPECQALTSTDKRWYQWDPLYFSGTGAHQMANIFYSYANTNAIYLFLQLFLVRPCLLLANLFGLISWRWSSMGLTLLLLLRLDIQLFCNPNPVRAQNQTNSTAESHSSLSRQIFDNCCAELMATTSSNMANLRCPMTIILSLSPRSCISWIWTNVPVE